jgi:hypothetical protein
MVDVGVLGADPSSGAHDGKEAVTGGVRGDRLVWHVEAARLQALAEVAAGVGAEGGEPDVVGDVEADARAGDLAQRIAPALKRQRGGAAHRAKEQRRVRALPRDSGGRGRRNWAFAWTASAGTRTTLVRVSVAGERGRLAHGLVDLLGRSRLDATDPGITTSSRPGSPARTGERRGAANAHRAHPRSATSARRCAATGHAGRRRPSPTAAS